MSQRLTPVDILNLRFSRSLFGYSVAEVDDFVRRAAGDMEALLTEIAVQRERMLGLEREMAQYHSMELALRDSLVLAQKAAEETRAAARLQADALLQEAQTRARDINAQLQARIDEAKSQLDRLRQERRSLGRELRAQLTAHLAWLDEEFETVETTAEETVQTPESRVISNSWGASRDASAHGHTHNNVETP